MWVCSALPTCCVVSGISDRSGLTFIFSVHQRELPVVYEVFSEGGPGACPPDTCKEGKLICFPSWHQHTRLPIAGKLKHRMAVCL